MKKHRINTTISAKHWEILKKNAVKYESQQKALEAALESLENVSKQSSELSHDQQAWMSLFGLDVVCLIHKDLILEMIITADFVQLSKLVT